MSPPPSRTPAADNLPEPTRHWLRSYSLAYLKAAAQAEELLTLGHVGLAASVQVVLEEVVLRMMGALAPETGARNLCLAGGDQLRDERAIGPNGIRR